MVKVKSKLLLFGFFFGGGEGFLNLRETDLKSQIKVILHEICFQT